MHTFVMTTCMHFAADNDALIIQLLLIVFII